MKVIVTKNLNVRVGKPSVNAPCFKYLAPGTELEVDGKLYPGDSIKGIKTWLKDDAGNYYWSGGFDSLSIGGMIMQDFTDKWWLKQFRIPEIWAKSITGTGIKIAVLDTGISFPHDDLALDNNLFFDSTDSPSGIQDFSGHGTHCAGIIKAINNEFGSIGIAYNSTLYVAKVTHDTRGDKNEYLIKAIQWAISNNVDIISISKGRPIADRNLELAIQEADTKGILVVAAAGNKTPGYPSDHIYYPARYKSVLSVGGIDENKTPINDSLLTNETQIFAPGNEILSTYKNNGYATLTGSSQATPYLAGVCALLLESERKNNPHFIAKNIKEKLFQYTVTGSFGKIIELSNFI